ncbi:MAG: class I tRNA ligase family protein [Patescibacteria group bacterium]
MHEKYNHQEIEKKWQEKWKEQKLYETLDEVKGKKNFYTLVEFPYPSGNLHIGHWYAFAVPDIFARTKRMQGYNVMFPIGFDAFGLPAENAAIKNKVDPKKWTYDNIAFMEKQLQSMGNSFDWSRKVITSDPEYYKWTQWLFLKLYEKGLAYKKKAGVNWCPSCNTVLANEQAVGGKCERCGTEVTQKDLEQWFFKITDYAERLLSDLDNLKWPEEIKTAQKNWIGKSEGTSLKFEIRNSKSETIEVFTTRADTLFGVTYLVVAPEYEKMEKWKEEKIIKNWDEVQNYINETKSKTEIERTTWKKDPSTGSGQVKTGVEIKGIKVVNPANGEEVPVFVADYVLGNYGTGAVMAVPAHDNRDFEFAKKYGLPVKEVIQPLITKEIGEDAFEKDKPVIERRSVVAVIKHWSEDKYLGAIWKKTGWQGFVIGGIEEGEDAKTAGLREITEETGYKNVEFVKTLPGIINARFLQRVKNQNRLAHFEPVLFRLKDGERAGVVEEEKILQDLKWLGPDEFEKFITHADMQIVWQRAMGNYCYTGDGEMVLGCRREGILVSSGEFNGLTTAEAITKITKKFGDKVTKYKLRDWLLSRQRYWGCPIPVVYDPQGKPHKVPGKNLPWLLPEDVKDFEPKGESPLVTSKELKERTEKIFGNGWKPEFDTMDTFVDSSWYFNRYTDPKNDKEFANKEKLKNWMPVKRYSGGDEHTARHVLYARFFHKALFDLGLVNEAEPFVERMNRGLILGPDGQKMSKSKGNVVDPDELVEKVGSDTVKMYLAFIGPYNETGQYPWDLGGVVGIRRFLERVWKIGLKIESHSAEASGDKKLENQLHKTIKKVTEDIENYKFNTAISAMMIFLNELEHTNQVSKGTFDTFLKLLAPFAPHMTEEIWNSPTSLKLRGANESSIHLEKWPKLDETKIKEEKITVVVQINGKVRAQFEAEVGISEKGAKEKALALPDVQKWLVDKKIKKIIFVLNKIVNFVV